MQLLHDINYIGATVLNRSTVRPCCSWAFLCGCVGIFTIRVSILGKWERADRENDGAITLDYGGGVEAVHSNYATPRGPIHPLIPTGVT